LRGAALDDTYFYLADEAAGKVWVWEGLPLEGENPSFSISMKGPGRLSSNGKYLAVTGLNDHRVYLFKTEDLSSASKPASVGGQGTFNLPQNAILAGESLLIADTGFNRVHLWKDAASAIKGKKADVVLGNTGPTNAPPRIGRDSLFWPAGLAFDGSRLWICEFKFSGRVLRFDAR